MEDTFSKNVLKQNKTSLKSSHLVDVKVNREVDRHMPIIFTVMPGKALSLIMYLIIVLGITLIGLTFIAMILKMIKIPDKIVHIILLACFLLVVVLLVKNLIF